MNYFIPTPDQLPAVLRSMRKERGLTQKEAALGCGLLPKTVSLLENDPGRCSVENLFKLISFLNSELHIMDKRDLDSAASSDEEW